MWICKCRRLLGTQSDSAILSTMCYSAQIRADYRKYKRTWGAEISIMEFVRLYWDRKANARINICKAMDAAFSEPENDDEHQIKTMIDEFNVEQAAKLYEHRLAA